MEQKVRGRNFLAAVKTRRPVPTGVCTAHVLGRDSMFKANNITDQWGSPWDKIEHTAMMTNPQDESEEEISHSDFVKIELAKLGYGSSGEVLPAGTLLADPDYVLNVALDEDLEPEVLEGVVWMVKNHFIDWPYQFWLADHCGHADRLDQVLAKAALTHLREQQSPDEETTIDCLAVLSSMRTPPSE
jgi:hypothetical protein